MVERDAGKKLIVIVGGVGVGWRKVRNYVCTMFIKSWINEMLQQPAGR